MSNEIRLEGKEELLAKLDALGRLDEAKAGLFAAAVYLQGKLSRYPESKRLTRSEVYGSTFKTDKQRRGFFAKLRHGDIQVPYHRGISPGSQRFKASWTAQAQNDGETIVIGNDTTYGPILMGKEDQSIYMKRVGWRDTDAILDEERETVLGIISDAIDASLVD